MTGEIEKISRLTSHIIGWLSDIECELLHDLAKNVPGKQAIVEIGSWAGKSTVWLAKGAMAGQKGRVYSVAPQPQTRLDKSLGPMNTYPAFSTNTVRARVDHIVVPLSGSSDAVSANWQNEVGLLWMDISRHYEDIEHHFLAWKPYLPPGAIVAIHDCDHAGPAEFVDHHFRFSSDFTVIRRVDTTVVAQRDECNHYWAMASRNTGVCTRCGGKRDFGSLFSRPLPLRRWSRSQWKIRGSPARTTATEVGNENRTREWYANRIDDV
jgi:hypothetical protein